jgi:hypothetical protein
MDAARVADVQLRKAITLHELERTRRASLFWQRQRASFLQLLVEAMDEFGITKSELTKAAKRMAEEQALFDKNKPNP